MLEDMDKLLPAILVYSFLYGNNMNTRTKKRIVLDALHGGKESTDALVLAMIVPFIHDHEMAIREVRKYIPKPHIGSFVSKLCDELKDSGSSSTAKICYAAFKKEINKYLEKTRKRDDTPAPHKTPKRSHT